MEDMEEVKKGKVCVTGGSGYLGSWMVMRLLQLGYSVNTTIRSHPGILQACLESKTVKRVVYTSSAATVLGDNSNIIDESSWTDVDLIRTLRPFASSYTISKTLTEKAALEFAEKNKIDLVTVIPTWIHGPFITPQIPGSVRSSLEMILGHQSDSMKYPPIIPFVNVDDVTNAHIFLFESPKAKGRYICSAVEITREKLAEFLLTRYPEFQKQITEYTWKSGKGLKQSSISSKTLQEIGFKYKYGLEEMFDGAIECCKQRDML